MRRIRVQDKDPGMPVTRTLPDVDPALRDLADPDPVVEEMVERLRSSLSGLVALDPYGRPVPWRQVVRIALGPTLARLHEDDEEDVIVLPSDDRGAGVEQAPKSVTAPAVGGRHYRPG